MIHLFQVIPSRLIQILAYELYSPHFQIKKPHRIANVFMSYNSDRGPSQRGGHLTLTIGLSATLIIPINASYYLKVRIATSYLGAQFLLQNSIGYSDIISLS